VLCTPRAFGATIALIAALGCRGGGETAPTGGSGSAPSPVEGLYAGSARAKDVVGHGRTYLVASESAVASRVGRDVLAAGGNAVDAAVATAFALEVVHPSSGNIGGGGFAVIHGKDLDRTLDFREIAPDAATTDMYLDASGKPTQDSIVGYRAVGVPGSVAGLWELHSKHGKLAWKSLVAPALALARDGFVVDAFLHASIVRRRDKLAKFPDTAALWMPNGTPRATGEKMTIPALASALEAIAEHGPDGFYTGEVADAIAAAMKEHGGLITNKDLRGYQAVWRAPLHARYRGFDLVAMPPPSSGGIVVALAANIFGALAPEDLPWHGAAHVHKLVEVWRRAFAARNEILGDPAFVTMPVDKLIAPDYARSLAATIGPRATPSREVKAFAEGNHTTNLCVVDAAGTAVALTTTLNDAFGSGVMVHGFFLNDEMDDFTAKPGAPNLFGLQQGSANKIEPRKRMLSSMSPTIAYDAQGIAYVLGAGGGPRIITAVWQTLSNVVDFGMTIDAAVAAPRVHHQHLPDVVFVEKDALAPAVASELDKLGYKLDSNATGFGAVTAIARAPGGGWLGTADPRNGGGASGD
jgi:gamma-glutamyltranspeptidase/glutathione hydrolase